ncbi:MAG: hypothetical protein OEM96_01680 [Gemmatimonadota bacterium]|nr:hypothetical protein [Gemmatimonadota bacterium]
MQAGDVGNGWSLVRLAESLEMQGKAEAAAEARERFTAAWGSADVTISASRM